MRPFSSGYLPLFSHHERSESHTKGFHNYKAVGEGLQGLHDSSEQVVRNDRSGTTRTTPYHR